MIAIASDHGGFELKTAVVSHFTEHGIPHQDYGCYNTDSVDYPEYANKVVRAIKQGESEIGILICGSGVGISIAANRHKGIRCALCHDVFSAKSAREHNDANILAMGEKVVEKGQALQMIDAFLKTDFSGDSRHKYRIELIDNGSQE